MFINLELGGLQPNRPRWPRPLRETKSSLVFSAIPICETQTRTSLSLGAVGSKHPLIYICTGLPTYWWPLWNQSSILTKCEKLKRYLRPRVAGRNVSCAGLIFDKKEKSHHWDNPINFAMVAGVSSWQTFCHESRLSPSRRLRPVKVSSTTMQRKRVLVKLKTPRWVSKACTVGRQQHDAVGDTYLSINRDRYASLRAPAQAANKASVPLTLS